MYLVKWTSKLSLIAIYKVGAPVAYFNSTRNGIKLTQLDLWISPFLDEMETKPTTRKGRKHVWWGSGAVTLTLGEWASNWVPRWTSRKWSIRAHEVGRKETWSGWEKSPLLITILDRTGGPVQRLRKVSSSWGTEESLSIVKNGGRRTFWKDKDKTHLTN